VCGAAPAEAVTVRGHQGMVVAMRFLRRQGMFCRTCALAVFRDMQADTMLLGWWGPLSALITPVTLLVNLGALSRIRRMPAPATTGVRPPLDPGRPVFRRPAGLVALLPLAALCALAVAVTALMVIGLVAGPDDSGPRALTAGSCVRNDGTVTDQDLTTVPCDSSDARFRVTAPDEDGACAAGDYIPDDPAYLPDGTEALCLHPLEASR
jgi:hypothetical protein